MWLYPPVRRLQTEWLWRHLGRLWQFVKEQNLPIGDFSPLCIYHNDPKVTPAEKLRTDVCMVMPVQVAPKGDVGFKTLPAGRYAIFLYKGRMTICKQCMILFTEISAWNGMYVARRSQCRTLSERPVQNGSRRVADGDLYSRGIKWSKKNKMQVCRFRLGTPALTYSFHSRWMRITTYR